MARYITIKAKVEIIPPQQLNGKTAGDIVRYMHDHYQTKGPRASEPANKATEYMMAVSKAIFDPEYWKNPIYVKFPMIGREWVKAVIIWYHGAEPIEGPAGIYSNGYACD